MYSDSFYASFHVAFLLGWFRMPHRATTSEDDFLAYCMGGEL